MIRRSLLVAALLVWPALAQAVPPPMAAVGVLNLGRDGRCSATLIAADLVLTAGHCVLRPDRRGALSPGGVSFRTGAYPGHEARTFAVADIVVHPLYIGADLDGVEWVPHDAGLVRLETSVPAAVARPIGVAASHLAETGPRLTEAPTFLASYRSGAGQRARERLCPVLRESPRFVPLSCDVRPGESGSPILASRGGELELVGIVSASTRTKRTETAIAAKAAPLGGALKAVMGGF